MESGQVRARRALQASRYRQRRAHAGRLDAPAAAAFVKTFVPPTHALRWEPVAEASQVEVRRLRAEDAVQLAACFERCYGSTYTYPEFYDPECIVDRIVEGSLRSAVADAGGERIVGHIGLTVRHKHAICVEAGNSVVDPAFRGHRLLARLGALLHQLCVDDGFIGYHHYPTTAHPIMQKAAAAVGPEMGLMLAHIPAETSYQEMDVRVRERIAALISYTPLAPAPRREVFAPTRYATLVERLYEQARFPRSLRSASADPKGGSAKVTVARSEHRRSSTITVHQTGDDLDSIVERELAQASLEVLHVDLLMNEPHLDHTIDVLHRQGFVYCGLLPEFLEYDVLRMQRVTRPTANTFRPELATDGGRALLREILADRR